MNRKNAILNLINPKLLQTLKKDDIAMYEISYQLDRILENYNNICYINGNNITFLSNGNLIDCSAEDIKSSSNEVKGTTLIFKPKSKVSFFDPLFANSYRLSFSIEGPRLSGLKLMFDIKRIEKQKEELCVTNIYNDTNNLSTCDANVRRFASSILERLEIRLLKRNVKELEKLYSEEENWNFVKNTIYRLGDIPGMYDELYAVEKKDDKPEFINGGNGISIPHIVSDKLVMPYISKSAHTENCCFNGKSCYKVTIYDLLDQGKTKYDEDMFLSKCDDSSLKYKNPLYNPKTITSITSRFLDEKYVLPKYRGYANEGKVLQK